MDHTGTVLLAFLSIFIDPSGSIIIETTDYCNKTLCRGDWVHTMCEHPDETPGPACLQIYSTPITDSQKEELLDVHNRLREHVASGKETRCQGGPLPTAADMGVMTWNDEIARIAQRLALTCVRGHDKCRDLKMMYLGQNLAQITYQKEQKSPPNMTALVYGWYDEAPLFSNDNIHHIDIPEDAGHFTQMFWAETYKLGCGYTSFFSEYANGWIVYLVCNYGPTGNWQFGDMYLIGPPCSKCPNGTTCGGDSRYPSLCSSDDGEVPDSLATVGLVYHAGQDALNVWHWSVLISFVAAVRAIP
ncbi:venom allergen 3-like [Amphibalanus amphitrite]|uniref:venom allergen 3-like n=1 Tax=Amphibalanus amphitrite TaxID=1232801 RepID=UPI001C918CDE|nr:venom allergen 3-like [Amphibalanus amphitrite]